MKSEGDRDGRAIDSGSANYRIACPGSSDCVLVRDCPQILVEATTRCYNSDRSLFCGVNQNFEPYVCCPSSYQSPNYQSPNFNSPPYVAEGTNHLNTPDRLSGTCGKSLIQSNYYKKLGAYPFVARIGFKSELCAVMEIVEK